MRVLGGLGAWGNPALHEGARAGLDAGAVSLRDAAHRRVGAILARASLATLVRSYCSKEFATLTLLV